MHWFTVSSFIILKTTHKVFGCIIINEVLHWLTLAHFELECGKTLYTNMHDLQYYPAAVISLCSA